MAQENFDEQVTQIPTSVDRVELRLHCNDNGDDPNTYEAYFEFYIKDQLGKRMIPVRAGNAIPHLMPDTPPINLSAAEFNGLQGLMDKVLAGAQSVIPSP